MASATGQVAVEFPASGDSYATVTITGQTGLTSAGYVEAWFAGADSTDNTVDDHALAASLCRPVCTPGAGQFTVTLASVEALHGIYLINWVWQE